MISLAKVKNYIDKEFIRKLYAMTDGIDAKEFRGQSASLDVLTVATEINFTGQHTPGAPDIHGMTGPWLQPTLLNGWAERPGGMGAGSFLFLGEFAYVLFDITSAAATSPLVAMISEPPNYSQFIVGGAVTYKPNLTISTIVPDALTVSPSGECEVAAASGLGPNIDYMFSGIFPLYHEAPVAYFTRMV